MNTDQQQPASDGYNPIFDVSGKIAMVTGASSGIGQHFARQLARHGAKVVVAARRQDRLDALVDDLSAGGAEAIAVSVSYTHLTLPTKA